MRLFETSKPDIDTNGRPLSSLSVQKTGTAVRCTHQLPRSPTQEEVVPIKDILKTHRTWEDGAGLMLGIAIGLSPWFYDEPIVPAVVLNSGLTGLAVLALAQLELVHLRRWEEIAQLACGLWLSASPFVFHYAHQDHLRFWHWALGAIVSVLAALELWQDWNRPDIRKRDS